jgi:hypothetical protein
MNTELLAINERRIGKNLSYFFMWWFPSFRAWVSALLLLFLFAPFVFALHTVGLIGVSFLGLAPPRASWPAWVFLLAIGLIVPVYIWGHVHQFFWGEPNPKYPRWLPSLSSLGEGLFTWIVTLAAMITAGIIFVIYVEASCSSADDCRYPDHEAFAFFLGGFLVTYSAYLYHWKLMAQRWWDSPARLKWFSSGKKKDPRREPKK